MIYEQNKLGIFNGSKGTIVGFAFRGIIPNELMPKRNSFHELIQREIPTVFVKMDLEIGHSISSHQDSIIPFVAICSPEDKYHKNYHRWQLPLETAFACTTHKMQGSTTKHGAVIEPSKSKPFARGLDYVAPSRPTEISKLILLGPLTETHFNSFPQERYAIRQEYDRLRRLFNKM